MPADNMPQQITLDEIRKWPPTHDLPDFARATNSSRSSVYALAKAGQLPVRVIKIGRRYRVVTASLISLLSGDANTAGGDAA